VRLNARRLRFAAGLLDRKAGEIHPGHFPAMLSQGEHVGARPAAHIQGATRWVTFHKSHQFWG
jgi:hypothetical protein